jgi:hypothetical protein
LAPKVTGWSIQADESCSTVCDHDPAVTEDRGSRDFDVLMVFASAVASYPDRRRLAEAPREDRSVTSRTDLDDLQAVEQRETRVSASLRLASDCGEEPSGGHKASGHERSGKRLESV